MAKRAYRNSDQQYEKWIKAGRGSGEGREYKPWLTVRDVPSEGRSHRVFGHKCHRIHHFFSDLELAVFFSLEWHPETVDIREQFPLNRDDTLRIARENGIRHPAVSGVQQFMSSDFLVNSTDVAEQKFALQVKMTQSLADARVVEKLEIERRFWLEKEIPWYLVTEWEVSQTTLQNISWLYPSQKSDQDNTQLIDRANYYQYHFSKEPERKIIDLCKHLDCCYKHDTGHSLFELRELLASRIFLFDIAKPVAELVSKDLKIINTEQAVEVLYVSG